MIDETKSWRWVWKQKTLPQRPSCHSLHRTLHSPGQSTFRMVMTKKEINFFPEAFPYKMEVCHLYLWVLWVSKYGSCWANSCKDEQDRALPFVVLSATPHSLRGEGAFAGTWGHCKLPSVRASGTLRRAPWETVSDTSAPPGNIGNANSQAPPRPTESETRRVRPSYLGFHKPSG